jgi:hypothetical protein
MKKKRYESKSELHFFAWRERKEFFEDESKEDFEKGKLKF